MSTAASSGRARVEPTAPVAFGGFVAYCRMFIGLMKASGYTSQSAGLRLITVPSSMIQ